LVLHLLKGGHRPIKLKVDPPHRDHAASMVAIELATTGAVSDALHLGRGGI